MIIKNKKQLEKIFREIRPYFPEVNPELRRLEEDSKYFMIADVLDTGDILYNEEIFGAYNSIEARGILAHEFGHLLNQRAMSHYSKKMKQEHRRAYDLNTAYRRKIERAADRTAVLRGFGKEMSYLISLSLLDEDWKKRISREHISLREIINIMKRSE